MTHEINPNFIELLIDKGLNIVLEWLKANNAPAEMIDLLDNCSFMAANISELRSGNLPDETENAIQNNVPETINLIYQLGGWFSEDGRDSFDFKEWHLPAKNSKSTNTDNPGE